MFRHRTFFIPSDPVTVIDPYVVRAGKTPYTMSKYARNTVVDKELGDSVRLKAVKSQYLIGKNSFRGLGNKNEYVEQVEVMPEKPEEPEVGIKVESPTDSASSVPPSYRTFDEGSEFEVGGDAERQIVTTVANQGRQFFWNVLENQNTQTDATVQAVFGDQGLDVLRMMRTYNTEARDAVYDTVVRPSVRAAVKYMTENQESWSGQPAGAIRNFLLKMFVIFAVQNFITTLGTSGGISTGLQAPGLPGMFPSATMIDQPTSTIEEGGAGGLGAVVQAGVDAGLAGAAAGHNYWLRRRGRR